MAAHANLVADVGLLRAGGQLAIIGSKPQPVQLNPRLLMPAETTVHGVFLPSSTPEEKFETHRALCVGEADGVLRRGLITTAGTFPTVQVPGDGGGRTHAGGGCRTPVRRRRDGPRAGDGAARRRQGGQPRAAR